MYFQKYSLFLSVNAFPPPPISSLQVGGIGDGEQHHTWIAPRGHDYMLHLSFNQRLCAKTVFWLAWWGFESVNSPLLFFRRPSLLFLSELIAWFSKSSKTGVNTWFLQFLASTPGPSNEKSPGSSKVSSKTHWCTNTACTAGFYHRRHQVVRKQPVAWRQNDNICMWDVCMDLPSICCSISVVQFTHRTIANTRYQQFGQLALQLQIWNNAPEVQSRGMSTSACCKITKVKVRYFLSQDIHVIYMIFFQSGVERYARYQAYRHKPYFKHVVTRLIN